MSRAHLYPDDIDVMSSMESAFTAKFNHVCRLVASHLRDEDGLPCAPDGQRYTTITSEGVKPVGKAAPRKLASSPEAAARAWWDEVVKFADGKFGTLYWCSTPSLSWSWHGKKRLWSIYSRFAVSA